MDVAEDIISMGEFTGHVWVQSSSQDFSMLNAGYVIVTFEPVYYLFIFVLLTLKYRQLGMCVKDEI